MLSPFGVDHPISKNRRQDTVAATAGAGIGGVVGARAHNGAHLASANRHLREATAHVTGAGHASPEGQEYHLDSARRHTQAGRIAARRSASRPLLAAAGLGGAALGAAGAVSASRAVSRRRITKSAFGIEHDVSKGRRQDVTATAAGATLGGTVAARSYPAAELRSSARHIAAHDAHERAATQLAYWPAGKQHGIEATRRWHRGLRALNRSGSAPLRVAAATAGATAGAAGAVAASRKVHKSAFGVEHSLATGTVPARLRLSGPQVPPQAGQAKPAKPPTQRLNNAIAATGGPSS